LNGLTITDINLACGLSAERTISGLTVINLLSKQGNNSVKPTLNYKLKLVFFVCCAIPKSKKQHNAHQQYCNN
jgi:hypothetical protein